MWIPRRIEGHVSRMCPLAIDVELRVVIEIQGRDAEADEGQRRESDAALRRGVSEQAALEAAIERVPLEIEVGDHQIQSPVTVEVASIDAHAGARLAVHATATLETSPISVNRRLPVLRNRKFGMDNR